MHESHLRDHRRPGEHQEGNGEEAGRDSQKEIYIKKKHLPQRIGASFDSCIVVSLILLA